MRASPLTAAGKVFHFQTANSDAVGGRILFA
jgi:hypothetical protein